MLLENKITKRDVLYLIFLILSSTILRFFLSKYIVWVMIPDSAWYASSAQSFFESFNLLISGSFNYHSMPLYSILISPAYYFKNIETNFLAIKFINSLVMSSTAIPAYLLAREFLSSWSSRIVALLSILIGPMFYTFTIMSESLHYTLVAWTLYFMYSSLANKSQRIEIVLGIVFGLALLNKMSSLALVISYFIILFILTAKESKGVPQLVKLPLHYLKILFEYKYVFIMLAATIGPYLVYRKLHTSYAPVPYENMWTLYSSKIMNFDIIGYLSWLLIYLGQLNISTGLFLLVPTLLVVISYMRSEQKKETILGITGGVAILSILLLATFQGGVNFGRLTERHFFAVSPLVLIFFFIWLANNKSYSFIHVVISLLIIISSYFALFKPSWTHIPACDSAFADTLDFFVKRYGLSKPILKTIVFSLSLCFILSTHLKHFIKLRFIYVTAIILFFASLSLGPYYLGHKVSTDSRRNALPQLQFIEQNISNPANLLFLNVPRELVLNHIIWNKDYQNKILFQARPQLESTSSLNPSDLEKLHKVVHTNYPTYLISGISNALLNFGLFTGEEISQHKTGLYIYKITEYKPSSSKSITLDFGTPSARQFLKQGWDKDEGPYPDMGFPTFTWATGNQSELVLLVEKRNDEALITFRAMTFYPDQSIEVIINGENVRTVNMTQGWNEYTVKISPSKIKTGENKLHFKFKIAKAPAETGGKDQRKLAVAFDWLTYR